MNWSGFEKPARCAAFARTVPIFNSTEIVHGALSNYLRNPPSLWMPGHNYPIVTHVKLEFYLRKNNGNKFFLRYPNQFRVFFLRRVGQLLQNKTSSRTTNENTAKRNHDSDWMEQINKSLSETWKWQRLQIYDFMFELFYVHRPFVVHQIIRLSSGVQKISRLDGSEPEASRKKIRNFLFAQPPRALQNALEIAMHGCNGALPNQSTYTVAQPEQFSFSMIKKSFRINFPSNKRFCNFY